MSRVRQMVDGLKRRYGPQGALAVGLASGLFALVPLPGMAFVPIALAELTRKKLRPPPVPGRADRE